MARPAALALDGKRDEGYQLLAQDTAGDLASGVAVTGTAWADLTNLYVTTDTTHLWVYAELPQYDNNSIGDFGLALDTDGLAGSGSTTGPVSTGITFAYTSTYNNVGHSPILTTSLLLPDVVIHGHLFSASPDAVSPVGWTELNHWTGTDWNNQNVNWGGITNTAIGTHVGFAYGNGVELSIPFSDLGIAPTSTMHLEFYAIGKKVVGTQTGAVDTVPADDQAQADHDPTTQKRLATIGPAWFAVPLFAFSASSYAVTEAQGSAPITITVAPTSSSWLSVTLAAANGTAGLGDYVPITQILTIGPGTATRVVHLQILPDALVEPDETVLLSLSQPVNGQLALPDTATLTIHDSPLNAKIFLPVLRR